MAYWLFWVKVTWEKSWLKKDTLTLLSLFSLKAGNKSPTWKLPSPHQEIETSLSPELGNSGLRSLYKQISWLLLIYYLKPKLCVNSSLIMYPKPKFLCLVIPHKFIISLYKIYILLLCSVSKLHFSVISNTYILNWIFSSESGLVSILSLVQP